jgi:diadenosine tetraphosphate (Ap4A) HIT family hydrolase
VYNEGMTNHPDHIHSQLLADTLPLLVHGTCHIRLHRNASLPWVILIPETNCIELCELSAEQQLEVTRLGQHIGRYFKQHMGAEKINFAAIGNVIQQLHIHIIGRHPSDPLWPDVVWGRPLPDKQWSTAELSELQSSLQSMIEDQQR